MGVRKKSGCSEIKKQQNRKKGGNPEKREQVMSHIVTKGAAPVGSRILQGWRNGQQGKGVTDQTEQQKNTKKQADKCSYLLVEHEFFFLCPGHGNRMFLVTVFQVERQ